MKLTELPLTLVEDDPTPRVLGQKGRRRLYDFDGWFHRIKDDDGRVRFMLVRGEHYHCSQSTMVNQVRVAACHAGLRVSVVDMEDRISVCVVPRPAAVHVAAGPESPTVVVPFVPMTNLDGR